MARRPPTLSPVDTKHLHDEDQHVELTTPLRILSVHATDDVHHHQQQQQHQQKEPSHTPGSSGKGRRTGPSSFSSREPGKADTNNNNLVPSSPQSPGIRESGESGGSGPGSSTGGGGADPRRQSFSGGPNNNPQQAPPGVARGGVRAFSAAPNIVQHVSHSLKLVNEGRAAKLIEAMDRHKGAERAAAANNNNNSGELGGSRCSSTGSDRGGGGDDENARENKRRMRREHRQQQHHGQLDDSGGSVVADAAMIKRPDPVMEVKKFMREERRKLQEQIDHEQQLQQSNLMHRQQRSSVGSGSGAGRGGRLHSFRGSQQQSDSQSISGSGIVLPPPSVVDGIDDIMTPSRSASRNQNIPQLPQQQQQQQQAETTCSHSIFDRIPRYCGLAGHYEKHQMLGQGSFGSTWLVEWVADNNSSDNNSISNGEITNRSRSGDIAALGQFTANRQMTVADVITPPRRAGPSAGVFAEKGQSGGNPAQSPAAVAALEAAHLFMNRKSSTATTSSPELGSSVPASGAFAQGSNPLTAHAMATASAFYTVNSPGAISSLACTKSFVRLTNGREVPSDRVFVCKIESNAAAERKTQISSQEFAEERILAKCAHPCVVGFVDEFNDDQNHYLIMEYVDGGDLRGEIQRRLDADTLKYFSEASLLFLFTQIMMGLEYLHRHNILHRDLKTSNLLLSRKWSVRLGDFGFAKQYDVDVDNNASVTTLGTPYYMAPEVLTKAPYSDKADIWACGVILYELITLHRPFDADTVQDLAKRIVTDDYDPIERDTVSEDLLDLVHDMLQKDPVLRPSAKEVLQLPVMQAAMDEFINKFTRAANASSSALDKLWSKVLVDHKELVLLDGLTGPKSKKRMQRARSRDVEDRFGSTGGGSVNMMGSRGGDTDASGGGVPIKRRKKRGSSATSTTSSESSGTGGIVNFSGENDDDDDDGTNSNNNVFGVQDNNLLTTMTMGGRQNSRSGGSGGRNSGSLLAVPPSNFGRGNQGLEPDGASF